MTDWEIPAGDTVNSTKGKAGFRYSRLYRLERTIVTRTMDGRPSAKPAVVSIYSSRQKQTLITAAQRFDGFAEALSQPHSGPGHRVGGPKFTPSTTVDRLFC